MPTVVDEALEYASLGWHVLPGKDKIPFVKWVEASCEPLAVTKMFERWPMAEILVLCGPSKLAVLDVDIYKAPIMEKLPQYNTWKFETPKGGMQYVFADPEGKIPTTAGRINPWTDTRGVGGLIVVPSVNSPKRKWIVKPDAIATTWPTDLPNLGTPAKVGTAHTDEAATWEPINVAGERLPTEDCPGSYHLTTGRQPRLGLVRLPDGRIRARCWSGCSDEEVLPLLLSSGRFTADELWMPNSPVATINETRFITYEDLKNLRPPNWMIEPYLQEGALVMLAAKFNTGKTFVALNWALDLSSQGKRVLYLALEGLNGLRPRVMAWEAFYGRSPGDILFNDKHYRLNLLQPSSVQDLCTWITDAGGFDLVVVDNLGEAFPGDENDSDSIGRAMFSLNQIRQASGGTLLDIHNSGHGGQVRARGHSKMLDVHDTVIYLEAIEGSINGLKVVCGKERNADRFAPRRSQLKACNGSLVAVMDASVIASMNPYYDAVKQGHTTVSAIEAHLNKSHGAVVENLKKLVDNGDLTVLTLGKQNIYSTMWDQPITTLG